MRSVLGQLRERRTPAFSVNVQQPLSAPQKPGRDLVQSHSLLLPSTRLNIHPRSMKSPAELRKLVADRQAAARGPGGASIAQAYGNAGRPKGYFPSIFARFRSYSAAGLAIFVLVIAASAPEFGPKYENIAYNPNATDDDD